MAAASFFIKPCYIFYYSCLLSCFTLHISVLEAAKKVGFSIDLIYRESPKSPYYNPSNTHFDRLHNSIRRSYARSSCFNPNSKPSLDSFESLLTSVGGEYLMSLSIGTPAVKILGIADTGSDLLWIQCKPCSECYKQKSPLFDPKQSSTYKDLSCQSKPCQALETSSTCPDNNICQYTMSYGDHSYTNGALAVETITFTSSSFERPVSFPKIAFGCGHNNGGTFNETGSGIIGLGGGPLSIINQLNSSISGKFSYCLMPLDSDPQVSSKMNFGANAVVSGPGVVSTPYETLSHTTFYYLTLESFSVGDKRLAYMANSMKDSKAGTSGNIIIDSGTTLTLLPRDLYNDLESALVDSIQGTRTQDPQGLLSLCYALNVGDQIDIPTITAHFTGADLELSSEGTFIRMTEDVLCLSMIPSDDLVIFGNLSQINFLIGYDLVKKEVSFKPTNCSDTRLN